MIAVLGLKGGIPGGPSGMRVKYLKKWRQESKREKDPKGRRWEPVVILLQIMFSYGTVLKETSWATMVLLQKGKGGYRGILIVEVLWKL